jgi:hypothetical protein
MATYQPRVIEEFADQLYTQAARIIALYTAVGVLIGGGIGYSVAGGGSALLGAIVLGGLGFALGQQRAFLLKLQAQTALCQLQIERNTTRETTAAGVRAS